MHASMRQLQQPLTHFRERHLRGLRGDIQTLNQSKHINCGSSLPPQPFIQSSGPRPSALHCHSFAAAGNPLGNIPANKKNTG